MKANVLFFDKKPAAEQPWTEKLWVYDLRTNQHFTLKQNPLRRADLDDFVDVLRARAGRAASGWSPSGSSRFTYDELVARDKANLDITWLRDESPRGPGQPARARDHRPRDRRLARPAVAALRRRRSLFRVFQSRPRPRWTMGACLAVSMRRSASS